MKLQKDLKEFLRLLHSHGVEFIVVGAHTFAFYGVPRYTGDIDLFVRVSDENAIRLEAVIREFGFESVGLSRTDFIKSDQVIQLGVAPHRIDLLTGLSGVTFEEAWETKLPVQLDEIPVYVLSKELLIRNKLTVGRAQDLVDVEALKRTGDT